MGEALWIDDYTLLCESCGYSLEDLDPSLPCPECSKPILESLPHLTAGSPWQNRHTLVNLIKTWFLSLVRPRHLFRQLNINLDSGVLLLLIGSSAVYLAAVLVTVLGYLLLVEDELAEENFLFLISAVFVAIICWIVTVVYSSLGVIRLRYFASRGCYRLTAHSRWTIVGHASLGLTIFPIVITLAFVAIFTMVAVDVTAASSVGNILMIVMATSLWLSIIISIIIFELLLLIGSRTLRHRNVFPEQDLDNEPPQGHDPLM